MNENWPCRKIPESQVMSQVYLFNVKILVKLCISNCILKVYTFKDLIIYCRQGMDFK